MALGAFVWRRNNDYLFPTLRYLQEEERGEIFARRRKMIKKFVPIILSVLIVGLAGCELKTPEIRGVVLDAETKQPVEAWVHATIWVNIKTLAGSTGKVISLDPPHTRSDKSGKFSIPQKEIAKPPFPMGFGTKVEKFTIGAATIDKGGQIEINVKDLEKGKIEVTLYLEDLEKAWQKELKHIPPEKFYQEKEMREFSSLQSLYNYCFTGRFIVETPIAEGGCDDWEINYTIAKHERYLENLKELKTIDQETHYSGTLKRLAYLYKKKGDYKRALETFKRVKAYEEKRGVDLWLKELTNQIIEIEKLLSKNIPK